MRYAEVVFPIPIKKSFHYRIPPHLTKSLKLGHRVLCSFGKRQAIGFVVDIVEKAPLTQIKDINRLIEPNSVLSGNLLKTANWMSNYYLSSLGEAINTIFPSFLKDPRIKKGDLVKVTGGRYTKNEDQNLYKDIADSIQDNSKNIKHRKFLVSVLSDEIKNDIYIRSIKISLNMDKGVIFLVPEISLITYYTNLFEDQIIGARYGVIHSRLSRGDRYQIWQMASKNEIDILIGTRSAVFAPFTNLGLIIIDSEHDPSYKEEKKPLYNACLVAKKRVELENATLILSSPTPSLESYYLSQPRPHGTGEYKLMPRRKNFYPSERLPSIKVIDMKNERWTASQSTIFSQQLKDSIQKRLVKKEQIILFLNRKGYSTLILCRRCGFILECPCCNARLVYHADKGKTICHYCRYEATPPEFCPHCRNRHIRYLGAGTQKIEEETRKIFPDIRIKRVDTEIAGGEKATAKILEEFKHGKADILIGTRIILKEHGYRGVSLLGVISIDTLSYIPDFRSSEKIFSLVYQLAKSIKQDSRQSEMLIQTYNPSHFALKKPSQYDYHSFYNKEIKFRKQLNYPPFSNLVNIIAQSESEKATSSFIGELHKKLLNSLDDTISHGETSILGPAPAYLARRGQNFRWQIVIKTSNLEKVQGVLKNVDVSRKKIKLTIDVDPIDLL